MKRVVKNQSSVRSRNLGRSDLRKGSIKKSSNKRVLKEVIRTELMASEVILLALRKIFFFHLGRSPLSVRFCDLKLPPLICELPLPEIDTFSTIFQKNMYIG